MKNILISTLLWACMIPSYAYGETDYSCDMLTGWLSGSGLFRDTGQQVTVAPHTTWYQMHVANPEAAPELAEALQGAHVFMSVDCENKVLRHVHTIRDSIEAQYIRRSLSTMPEVREAGVERMRRLLEEERMEACKLLSMLAGPGWSFVGVIDAHAAGFNDIPFRAYYDSCQTML